MKQLLLLFSMMLVFGLTTQAQDCTYAKKTNASVEKTQCTKSTAAAAAKLASMDASIESRTCAQSGKVSYVRKSVCDKSGKVSYTGVEYCSKSAKFVNISPRQQACSKSKASAEGNAKATKVSDKKGACTSAQKAACAKTCTGASKSKVNAAPKQDAEGKAKVKLVKGEE
ncbi:MAG: hypothetical protein MI974_33240 [Chitinophagales bacterium]|nr:hypothetical protein [Chitinophagales bacterium]